MSVRAVDEWLVRDGVVVVMGLDYSRFTNAGGDSAMSPRIGVQFDANARTRVRASYAPGGDEGAIQSTASFEDTDVFFRQPQSQPVAFVGGRAVMGQSRRLEFGMQRVLDNRSNIDAAAFLDMTSGRGVGLMAMPLSAFSGDAALPIMNVANQSGSARGMRVVYSRRLNQVWSASAGYSFGRGQKLSANGISDPTDLFSNGFFQTAAFQVEGDWSTGTHVQTVFRFSPQATVFAIDPFAGRLAVYDPSLSVQVTQDLPTFGLPVRAQAIIDARNLFDFQTRTMNSETVLELGSVGTNGSRWNPRSFLAPRRHDLEASSVAGFNSLFQNLGRVRKDGRLKHPARPLAVRNRDKARSWANNRTQYCLRSWNIGCLNLVDLSVSKLRR